MRLPAARPACRSPAELLQAFDAMLARSRTKCPPNTSTVWVNIDKPRYACALREFGCSQHVFRAFVFNAQLVAIADGIVGKMTQQHGAFDGVHLRVESDSVAWFRAVKGFQSQLYWWVG